MERATAKDLRFDPTKFEFKKKEMKFVGHIITADGIKADPEKVDAIINMKAPHDKTSLLRFYRYDQLPFALLRELELHNTSTDRIDKREYGVYMVNNTKRCIQQGKECNCYFTSTAVLQFTEASDIAS